MGLRVAVQGAGIALGDHARERAKERRAIRAENRQVRNDIGKADMQNRRQMGQMTMAEHIRRGSPDYQKGIEAGDARIAASKAATLASNEQTAVTQADRQREEKERKKERQFPDGTTTTGVTEPQWRQMVKEYEEREARKHQRSMRENQDTRLGAQHTSDMKDAKRRRTREGVVKDVTESYEDWIAERPAAGASAMTVNAWVRKGSTDYGLTATHSPDYGKHEKENITQIATLRKELISDRKTIRNKQSGAQYIQASDAEIQQDKKDLDRIEQQLAMLPGGFEDAVSEGETGPPPEESPFAAAMFGRRNRPERLGAPAEMNPRILSNDTDGKNEYGGTAVEIATDPAQRSIDRANQQARRDDGTIPNVDGTDRRGTVNVPEEDLGSVVVSSTPSGMADAAADNNLPPAGVTTGATYGAPEERNDTNVKSAVATPEDRQRVANVLQGASPKEIDEAVDYILHQMNLYNKSRPTEQHIDFATAFRKMEALKNQQGVPVQQPSLMDVPGMLM